MEKDIEDAKTKARKVRAYLASKGVELGAGETLELLSLLEGAASWNVLSDALGKRADDRSLFCPHCGHRGKVKDIGYAKVQQGPWLIDNYMVEGEGTQYGCEACGKQFLDWDGGLLYRNRDHLVVVVTELEEGDWVLEGFEAIDVARALHVENWDALQQRLSRLAGETLIERAELVVPKCTPVVLVEGASRDVVLASFSCRTNLPPVLKMLDYLV
jgi:DNA-directed RNA polymerase subunit RPC12/RpoP